MNRPHRALSIALASSLTACSFALPALDLTDRPCAEDGSCADGFVCNEDDVCVVAGEEGEGEEGEGDVVGEGEGDIVVGEGEGEGEVVVDDPFVFGDRAAFANADTIVTRTGEGFDITETDTGRRVSIAIAELNGERITGLQACHDGIAPHAIFSTTATLIANDDNAVADIYEITFGNPAVATLVSKDHRGVFPAAGPQRNGSIEPRASADCRVVAYASDSVLLSPAPSGFNANARHIYVSIDGATEAVEHPDGTIGIDFAISFNLSAAADFVVFSVGQETSNNVIAYDVGEHTATPLLTTVANLKGGCPELDGDELLIETSSALLATDIDGQPDLYLAHNPFGAAPTFERVGEGLRNPTPVCGHARLIRVGGVATALVATNTAVTVDDLDSSADVYRVDDGAPGLVSHRPDTCDPLAPVLGDTRLDVFGTRYLLQLESNDQSGGDFARAVVGEAGAACP